MTGELQLKISTDMMTASGCISKSDCPIDADIIKSRLAAEGINIGIKEENIGKLLEKNEYDLWVTLAEGKPAGESKAGFFEFFFDTSAQMDTATTIKEDGTVSYGRKKIEVHEGDKLCVYHHPVSGAFGYTVFSTMIAPKPVQELKLDAKEGVRKEEDTYYAAVAGEVILTWNSISVNNVLTIEGDAKYGIDSDTEFVGDIHIKGDVLTGVTIKGKGHIDIDGTVEAANIFSDTDIIIKGGIKGDGKAVVEAKGSVVCPFVENGVIIAGDTIQADYVMRSRLVSGNAIRIHGQRGTIVGSIAETRNEFVADVIGNEAGTETTIGIKHPDLRLLERSFIMATCQVYDNVFFRIGEFGRKMKFEAGVEYHMVNNGFVTCEPGKYVPQRTIASDDESLKKTVLVVDDEPVILKTFFGFLHENYNVVMASSAKDALAIMNRHAPDLILLDVRMPVMNGAEFLTTIREMTVKDYSQIPVVFVTGANDRETFKRCMQLYPQGYLIKPLSKDELLAAVDKYIA